MLTAGWPGSLVCMLSVLAWLAGDAGSKLTSIAQVWPAGTHRSAVLTVKAAEPDAMPAFRAPPPELVIDKVSVPVVPVTTVPNASAAGVQVAAAGPPGLEKEPVPMLPIDGSPEAMLLRSAGGLTARSKSATADELAPPQTPSVPSRLTATPLPTPALKDVLVTVIPTAGPARLP